MCLLVNVPTTFVSSTGASAVAVAATAAAGTSATASPVAPRAPTGISRLISFPSPIWILSVPPATVAAVATVLPVQLPLLELLPLPFLLLEL